MKISNKLASVLLAGTVFFSTSCDENELLDLNVDQNSALDI
jgi:hypothetical protein